MTNVCWFCAGDPVPRPNERRIDDASCAVRDHDDERSAVLGFRDVCAWTVLEV
jgi:hypothetical protein